jgi:hypothetical protein
MGGLISQRQGRHQRDVVCKKLETPTQKVSRLKNQHLAASQVVVCKIHQPPFLVPHALLPTISFYLLRVVLAIFLPIVGVRFAPLPWTVQADLLIHRIGGDLLSMIIATALALACRLSANPLLGMIRGRLKNLLTVGAAVILHQAAPEENGRGSFSLEARATKPERASPKNSVL